MDRAILCSKKDQASINIRNALVDGFSFRETDEVMFGNTVYRRGNVKIVTIDTLHIYACNEVENLEAELIVVASRHVSEAGVKAMLAHPVGNWNENAQYGGKPNELTPTSAYAIYAAVQKLKELISNDKTQIGVEATHHGPYSRNPLIFVELGSSQKEWEDRKLGEIVAEAIITACEYDKIRSKPDVAVGFGGGHYVPKFTQLILREEMAFGHMAAKYVFPIKKELVEQAFDRTIEHPKVAYVDWKGIKSEYRQELLRTLKELGYDYIKV